MVVLLVLNCSAQQSESSADGQKDPDANSRILGVLPNFLTTDSTQPFAPLAARKKLSLAVQESIDWPQFIFNGGLAYLYQLQKQNPSFGNGFAGYGKRYAAVTADQTIGNLLTDGIFPALFHDDPRYFRRGTGSFSSRLGFALKQTVVERKDSGQWHFAISEWLGAGTGAAISNLYYRDSRTVSGNAEKFAVQIGGDTLNSVLEEFWPDVKRKFFTRRHS